MSIAYLGCVQRGDSMIDYRLYLVSMDHCRCVLAMRLSPECSIRNAHDFSGKELLIQYFRPKIDYSPGLDILFKTQLCA